MKFSKIVSALVIGVLLVSVVGCGLVSKTPEAIAKTPVGKVNGEIIMVRIMINRLMARHLWHNKKLKLFNICRLSYCYYKRLKNSN